MHDDVGNVALADPVKHPLQPVSVGRACRGTSINELIDNQVRSLRKRQVIGSYNAGERKGTYWGIRSDIADYPAPDPLPCPPEATQALAEYPTRLAKVSEVTQERLINWGYGIADAAMRAHVDLSASNPNGFPYPSARVSG